jgi:autotransporter-associated beta strand protein
MNLLRTTSIVAGTMRVCQAVGAAAIILTLFSAPAEAQLYTWSGATTDFNLTTNWSPNVPSFPTSGTMSFTTGTTASTFQPQLTASATIGALSFGTTGYRISPGSAGLTLSLANSGTVLTAGQAANSTISSNLALLGSGDRWLLNDGVATLSGVISGTVDTLRFVTAASPGQTRRFLLTGTQNSFTATPVIGGTGYLLNGGMVYAGLLGNSGGLSSLGTSGTIRMLAGGGLWLTGTGESSDKSFFVTDFSSVGGFDGSSTSAGFVNFTLTGSVTNVSGTSATLYMVGSGTMAGKITQTAGSGSVSLMAGGNYGTAVALTLSNTTNDFTGMVSVHRGTTLVTPMFGMSGSASPLGKNGTIRLNHDATLNASTTLRFSGVSESSDKTFSLNTTNGIVTLNTGTGTLELTNTAAWGGGSGANSITLSGSGAGSLAATLPNSSNGLNSLIKSGTGSWTLSGANTYTGTTRIDAGTLTFATRASLYNAGTASWTKANITTGSGGAATVGFRIGGAGEFTTSDVTTLLSSLGGDVGTGGLRATTSWGFDTTNAGSTVTINDTIANTSGGSAATSGGAIGVVKLGSGTLSLAGANTYTLGTEVRGGVLTIANNTVLGSGTGFLRFTGGTLDLAGNTVDRGGPMTATAGGLTNGVLTGSAGLTKTGGGTFRIDSTANTFMGATAIQEGVVEVASIAAAGVASSLGSGTGANATVNLGNLATSGTFRYIGGTSGTMSRTLNLAGSSGGGAIENNGDGPLVISSAVTATGVGVKTLTLGGTSTAANTIGAISNGSGTTSVAKDGPGLWRINAVSSYTGSFTVRNGTLVAAADSTSTNGAFGASSVTDVFVGDSSPTATGTAALLLAAGFNTTKVMNVQAGGGSQVVVLGGEGGAVDFQNSTYLGRGVTLVAGAGGTTSFSGQWYGSTGFGSSPVGNVSIGSAGNTGMVRILRGLATSGSVGVRFGTLNLGSSGTIAGSGPLAIDSGATLAGIGVVAGTLGGAGLVAPGNSPGILTAAAVDPTSGLDWAFEFTNAAPNYGDSSNSLNDILRLTGTASAPFTTALTSANEIAVYLDVASLAEGNTFSGGFFTNLAGDFRSSIAGAAYSYWVSGTGAGQTTYQSKTYVPLATAYPSLSMDVTTVTSTATFFGESPTNGQVTTFTVVVPEPGTLALAALGLGLAGWAIRRRRAA